jgi:hypothetical protein
MLHSNKMHYIRLIDHIYLFFLAFTLVRTFSLSLTHLGPNDFHECICCEYSVHMGELITLSYGFMDLIHCFFALSANNVWHIYVHYKNKQDVTEILVKLDQVYVISKKKYYFYCDFDIGKNI